ncbi:sensor histidine kinase [Qipengyuania sp.]|uniref:sensor histidine kinase n=1 Tax=Qipengyuania sp. TaxID=2004515 RepID=UPI0035C872AD
MSIAASEYLARGAVTEDGVFETDDELLASIQIACGGRVGGQLAVPELRSLVEKADAYRLRLSRPFTATGVNIRFSGWVEINPARAADNSCEIRLVSCRSETLNHTEDYEEAERIKRELNRTLPEFVARLDPDQGVMTTDTQARDLLGLAREMCAGPIRPWTDFVTVSGALYDQPLHWRLLDGATCRISGSERPWTAWLEPLGVPNPGSGGFVLTLVSSVALQRSDSDEFEESETSLPALTQDLAPAIRQPLNNIVASAEAIQMKLAGPLADIYSGYGGDMVAASEHLEGLLEDVVDLEAVEASELIIEVETIDLGKAARQACGILGAKASARDISLVPPGASEVLLGKGDYRRVLQILINVIGNAIAYAPAESQVWVRLDQDDGRAMVTVADQGRGLTNEEQRRIFDKFERLGRKDEGGSGLGLYIASHLADAMDGTLCVESAPGHGARFTLSLPSAE